MKTYSFIGSHKNAGKTTAFNFVYKQFAQRSLETKIALTSIGINGEPADHWNSQWKPVIEILPSTMCITTPRWIEFSPGLWKIKKVWSPPYTTEKYLLIEAKTRQKVILEGPNQSSDLIQIKNDLLMEFNCDYLLVDGSIDREFMAHPKISDGFYLNLLWPNARSEQILKIITLPTIQDTNKAITSAIHQSRKNHGQNHKVIVMDRKNGKVLISSTESLCQSRSLQKDIFHLFDHDIAVYLNSAWTKDQSQLWQNSKNIHWILDHFSLYLDDSSPNEKFYMYHKPQLIKVFLKEDLTPSLSRITFHPNLHSKSNLITKIPAINIFREDHHEIRL